MGSLVRILGTIVKVVTGPVSSILHTIPPGQATGAGTATFIAGALIHAAVVKGWIPGGASADLTNKLAIVVGGIGAFVTAWGAGRAKGRDG